MEVIYVDEVKDLPEDQDVPPDNDDSIPPENRQEQKGMARELPIRTKKHVLVPFVRELRLGSRGNDVRAVKRALKKAGYGKGITMVPVFGNVARRNLKKFQKHHGGKPTGIYDKGTHRHLMPFFDSYGIFLLTGKKWQDLINDKKKAKAVAAAFFLYHHRDQTHYTLGSRRMSGVRDRIKPPHVPPYEDCSSSCTWYYWIAKLPDPNGSGYNGQGYTGTLIRQGRRIGGAALGIADLVFYGSSNGIPTHVAISIGYGKVISNGSEGGPYLVRYNYRSDVNQERNYA